MDPIQASPAPKPPRSFLKRFTVPVLILLCLGYASVKFIAYGSIFRSCNYTEESIAVPEDLRSAVIVFTKDTQLATGKNFEYGCLTELGKIEREILPPDQINNETINTMYERNGLKLEASQARSKQYRVINIYAVTKHGISTIDSGPGPEFFLVLSDENGQRYEFATVFFSENGSSRGNESVASAIIAGKEYPLIASNFMSFEPRMHFIWDLNPKVQF